VETVITEQSAKNVTYVRRLLRQKQPGFAAALELAVLLAERGQACFELPCLISAGERL